VDQEQRQRGEYMKLFAIEGKAEQVLLEDGARRLRRLFTPLADEQIEAYVEPLLAPGALTGALNWYRRLERSLPGVAQVPVTFIWGSRDVAIGPLAARGCQDFVSGPYRFVPIEGISHWVPDQVPETVAAEVLARTSATAE
jgi:pimeloyl-ACP methyl ester carboxylesterase